MSTIALPEAAPPAPSLGNKIMQVVLAGLVLAVSVGLLASLTTNDHIANCDFIEYWAAGQQLLHGHDPYDPVRITAMERSAGRHVLAPTIMFNPPSALLLTLPLGAVGPRTGYLVWTLVILAAWLGSVHLLWIMNGRSKNALHFVGYFFAPALGCFLLGQMAAFVLLGLTLFFYFHLTRPFLAGAALMLCALKPHLFFPFWIVLFSWVLANKAYRVLLGAAIALAVACAIPLWFDPSIYSQYLAMSRLSGIKQLLLPTLSEVLRFLLDRNALWIQFLPALGGCLWALWYFRRHFAEWDWHAHGSLLMLVSLLVTPYAWYFDAVVVLPALFYAAYRARPRALAVLVVFLTADQAQFFLRPNSFSALHLWSSTAWLIWYLWPMGGWLLWYLWAVRNPRLELSGQRR